MRVTRVPTLIEDLPQRHADTAGRLDSDMTQLPCSLRVSSFQESLLTRLETFSASLCLGGHLLSPQFPELDAIFSFAAFTTT